MATPNEESIMFYRYLSEKFGTPRVVKTRRLMFAIADVLNTPKEENFSATPISSGSKAEGLDLFGSDMDIMFLQNRKIVYETLSDAIEAADDTTKLTLVMETENTKPCFTRLRILRDQCSSTSWSDVVNQSEYFRNDYYKDGLLREMNKFRKDYKIHGPCVTTNDDDMDVALCFRCEKWITEAQPWLYRARTSWPPSNIISKMTSFGVLFVPIGCKGSKYEHLEWRISFSFAEKLMVFSFNHTQLLCYGLMKILLKELIDCKPELNGLLCSYFIKTLLFWIFEQSQQTYWRPENLISCYMLCLKRLIHSVETETLLHYFIPENNLFEDKFSRSHKASMMSYLYSLYQQGWRCFGLSKTLNNCHFKMLVHNSRSSKSIDWLLRLLANHYLFDDHKIFKPKCVLLLPELELQSHRDNILREICIFHIAKYYQCLAHFLKPHKSNKMSYFDHKLQKALILLGCSTDSVSGWMHLASYFYFYKNYDISLKLLKYSLSKCTEYMLCYSQGHHIFNETRKELISFLRTSVVKGIYFLPKETLIPEELKSEINRGPIGLPFYIPPTVFGLFLTGLCYHHQGNYSSCLETLKNLENVLISCWLINPKMMGELSISSYCIGILYKILGDDERARNMFKIFTIYDAKKKMYYAEGYAKGKLSGVYVVEDPFT